MIEVTQLGKSFGKLAAVRGIDFTVRPGEVLGFLGPNGAGKSTTMKMIAGFLAPTTGSVRVCGCDVQEDTLAARRLIGYLPEGAPGYGDMTVLEFLRFIAEVRGFAGAAREAARGARAGADGSRRRAPPAHRDAVQGLQAPRRPGAGDPARSAGADPRRAHRRPRSEPEAPGARADPRAVRREDRDHLHAHPRGGRRRVHPRDHHRARAHRGRRHAARARGALALPPRGAHPFRGRRARGRRSRRARRWRRCRAWPRSRSSRERAPPAWCSRRRAQHPLPAVARLVHDSGWRSRRAARRARPARRSVPRHHAGGGDDAA